MTPQYSNPELDLAALAHRYLDGILSPAEKTALTDLLRANDQARADFVRCLLHQVRLEEVFARRKSDSVLNGVEPPVSAPFEIAHPLTDQKPANPMLGFNGKLFSLGNGNWSAPFFGAVLLGSIILSVIVTSQIVSRPPQSLGGPQNEIALTREIQAGDFASDRNYTANLVTVTNCRWDNSRGSADIVDGKLRPGQSLHLLEGVARINSTLANGGVGDFHLEGPLAMMLTSEGMPSLLYGKLTGEFTCDFDRFTLDTPLGRIAVSGNASIGVTAAANEVELHVFSGSATFDIWSIGLGSARDPLKATAGNSLRARVAGEGAISVDRGKSRENRFVTPAAIAASQLAISEEYVQLVRAAKPIAYWRFEAENEGLVKNEMGNRLPCRMVGDAVRLSFGQVNNTAEFGVTAGPGYLISEESLNGLINDNYSVEGWVKPRYYHHAAMFSLLQWSPGDSPFQSHRLMVELCGPISGYWDEVRVTDSHPGRIRFMHQNSECFSSSPYTVRKWQHVAAIKQHSAMRLYVDGELVADAKDDRTLGTDLRVLMGQLYPQNPHVRDDVTSRLYVGELDEVALYDRALEVDEIQQRVRVAHQDAKATLPAHEQDY